MTDNFGSSGWEEVDSDPLLGTSTSITHEVTAALFYPVGPSYYTSNPKGYTLITLPIHSYNAAADALVKVFGHYYAPLGIQSSDVELLFTDYAPTGEAKIWISFGPSNWKTAVEQIKEFGFVGIREVTKPFGKPPSTGKQTVPPPTTSWGLPNRLNYETQKKFDADTFEIGHVCLTYGSIASGRTIWTSLPKGEQGKCEMVIDRPASYKEAIQSIQTLQALQTDIFTPGGLDLSAGNVIFNFYTFPSKDGKGEFTTDTWVKIPDSAHIGSAAWRRYVPLPFQILGFSLQIVKDDL